MNLDPAETWKRHANFWKSLYDFLENAELDYQTEWRPVLNLDVSEDESLGVWACYGGSFFKKSLKGCPSLISSADTARERMLYNSPLQ